MKTNFPFIKYKKIYFIFSGILIAGSLVSILAFGLKLGIEFTGGSLIEVEFEADRPSNDAIEKNLSEFNVGEVVIQPTGDRGAIVRLKEIDA